MRRFLVLFLILLFPLNVLALSMSASVAHAGESAESVRIADAFAGASHGDVDPDEPPSVADLHDILHHEPSLRPGGPPAGAVPPHAVARYSHAPPPPLKPPCTA